MSFVIFRSAVTARLNRWLIDVDKHTLLPVLVLFIVGIVAILSVSPAIAGRISVAKFYIAQKHIVFVVVAIGTMIAFSCIAEEWLITISIVLGLISLLLLAGVLFGSSSVKGAKRWIDLGVISLQPSEILKPFFIIINSFFLQNIQRNTLIKIFCSSILTSIICLLLILEPDNGMMLLYVATWLAMLFFANINLRFLGIVGTAGLFGMLGVYLAFDHVRYRINAFFSGDAQLQYQVKKAIQSVAEGGFFGKGPGEGIVKFQLPDSYTDYIFATIAEEWGYIICCAIICIYFYISLHNVALHSLQKNDFKRYAIFGIIFMFTLQVFINIGVSINMMPSKGMTLPFISYGGSAMIGMAMMFGILLSLTRKNYGHVSIYDSLKLTVK
jgi:cell division protein FtsW